MPCSKGTKGHAAWIALARMCVSSTSCTLNLMLSLLLTCLRLRLLLPGEYADLRFRILLRSLKFLLLCATLRRCEFPLLRLYAVCREHVRVRVSVVFLERKRAFEHVRVECLLDPRLERDREQLLVLFDLVVVIVDSGTSMLSML